MAGACIYLFWWKKNNISGLMEDSDAENIKKTKKIFNPPVTADTLCPRGISTECFEKLVSSISKGAKMLHFIYFVYIFF